MEIVHVICSHVHSLRCTWFKVGNVLYLLLKGPFPFPARLELFPGLPGSPRNHIREPPALQLVAKLHHVHHVRVSAIENMVVGKYLILHASAAPADRCATPIGVPEGHLQSPPFACDSIIPEREAPEMFLQWPWKEFVGAVSACSCFFHEFQSLRNVHNRW